MRAFAGSVTVILIGFGCPFPVGTSCAIDGIRTICTRLTAAGAAHSSSWAETVGLAAAVGLVAAVELAATVGLADPCWPADPDPVEPT